ncbi:hypothetical protein BRC72_08255 [Halobacteriales archaeon QH_7_66_36]|nr:MAG: hypothetical protein BRC72_08255 [Halobacteriales archaeon QH_7_66_36]
MLPLQVIGDGLVGSFAQAVVAVGSLLFLMLLIALGTFAYRNLRGDGVEWPDEEPDDDEVRRGGDEDEWDYY